MLSIDSPQSNHHKLLQQANLKIEFEYSVLGLIHNYSIAIFQRYINNERIQKMDENQDLINYGKEAKAIRYGRELGSKLDKILCSSLK